MKKTTFILKTVYQPFLMFSVQCFSTYCFVIFMYFFIKYKRLYCFRHGSYKLCRHSKLSTPILQNIQVPIWIVYLQYTRCTKSTRTSWHSFKRNEISLLYQFQTYNTFSIRFVWGMTTYLPILKMNLAGYLDGFKYNSYLVTYNLKYLHTRKKCHLEKMCKISLTIRLTIKNFNNITFIQYISKRVMGMLFMLFIMYFDGSTEFLEILS